MHITRRHWIHFICTLPFSDKLSEHAFAAQHAHPKTRYMMNRFYIAGFQFYQGSQLAGHIRPSECLMLATEEDNPHDRFAVKIERNSVMIGHVPRIDNFHISRLLRQGADVQCEVEAVNLEKESWRVVRVLVSLKV